MIQRVSRALRLVQTERDMHDRGLDLDERVEAVVQKIDSLEVRVEQLESESRQSEPGDGT